MLPLILLAGVAGLAQVSAERPSIIAHTNILGVPPPVEALKATQPSALTIQIPIDHFSTDNRTYSNRYWINGTYYKPGGPVFYMDGGEDTISDAFVQAFLMESHGPSSVMQLAAKHNGLAVMLEHRFYGDSLPYPVNYTSGLAPAGYEAYQYLTTEQALEDVVYFANNLNPKGYSAGQLTPSQTPWVFIGGSYSGVRAAWLRVRNPDVIFASWASSAPVQTIIDMSTYYEQVYTDMTANCSADLAAASSYLTETLTSGTSMQKSIIKIMSAVANVPNDIPKLNGMSDQHILANHDISNATDFDLAQNLGNFIGGNLQSYGFSAALLPFCNYVEQFDYSKVDSSSISRLISTTFDNSYNATSTPKGIAADKGKYAAFLAIMFGIYQQTLYAQATRGQIDKHATADAMSWQYQTCTEFGYFQVANGTSPKNLLSTFVNVTSWQQNICNDVFPFKLPSSPDVKTLVDRYGGWSMNPSQVMFTDGLLDPWHTLSVQSRSTNIGAPNRATTQSIPECGKGASGTDVFGLVYPDYYHVNDLQGPRAPVTQGITLFDQALTKWLPCFQKHSITTNVTATAAPSPKGTSAPTNIGSSPTSTTSPPPGSGAALVSSGRPLLGAFAAVLAACILL